MLSIAIRNKPNQESLEEGDGWCGLPIKASYLLDETTVLLENTGAATLEPGVGRESRPLEPSSYQTTRACVGSNSTPSYRTVDYCDS